MEKYIKPSLNFNLTLIKLIMDYFNFVSLRSVTIDGYIMAYEVCDECVTSFWVSDHSTLNYTTFWTLLIYLLSSSTYFYPIYA